MDDDILGLARSEILEGLARIEAVGSVRGQSEFAAFRQRGRCPDGNGISVAVLDGDHRQRVVVDVGIFAGTGDDVAGRGHDILGRDGRIIDCNRRVVHRRHVERDGFRRRVEIDAAVGRAAVVLHLESEFGEAGTVGVGGGSEHQLARSDVGK